MANDPDPDPENTLERLLESGKFSDLVIQSSTRHFNVHRNIICTSSAWFKAACTSGFQEAETGIIRLPEEEPIVKAVLQHLYNIEPSIFAVLEKKINAVDSEPDGRSALHEDMMNTMQILIAAQKYQLTRLCDRAREVLWAGFCELSKDLHAIVPLGVFAFSQEELCDSSLLDMIANKTAIALVSYEIDFPDVADLSSNQDYAYRVLCEVAKVTFMTGLKIKEDLDEKCEYYRE